MEITGTSEEVERPTKGRKTSAESQDMKKLMILVAKLSLSNSLSARVLRACTIEAVKVPADSLFITKAIAATRLYADQAKGMERSKKQAELRHPHTHVWNSWIIVAATKTKEGGAEIHMYKKTITDMAKDGGQGKALANMGVNVKYARVCKMYDASYRRVEVNIREPSREHTIWKGTVLPLLLSEQGAETLEGTAPPGDLERRIQEAITELGA